MHILDPSIFVKLTTLTAPGAAVAPVVEALGTVATSLDTARPELVSAHASEWMLAEVDRVRGAANTLRDSLTDLAAKDGMTTFDPAFSSDDPSWDAWFTEAADVVIRAQSVLDAAGAQRLLEPTAV